MKSQVSFLQWVLQEEGHLCGVNTTRDIETISSRFEDEGLSFFSITLPNYANAFHNALEAESWNPELCTSFKYRGGLPVFLGGFLDLIFDRTTGHLVDVPNIEAIRAVRQITMAFGKMEMQCTPKRERKAFLQYIDCERQVKQFSEVHLTDGMLNEFNRVSNLLFGQVLSNVDLMIYRGVLLPKHGPGSTADGFLGNQKYTNRTWTERAESIFPAMEMLFSSWSVVDRESITWLEPDAEIPVKVITVPKTQKTPRIIAMEPAHMQYMQQAISSALVREIEESHLVSPLVGFSDQLPNREMARIGSLNGSLSTLDLSEASDRVSWKLVQAMLRNHPWLSAGVDACRTRTASVEGFGLIPLSKFASMGSALTFPIEAMVFLTLVFMGLEKRLGEPVTVKLIKGQHGKVRVYGDDIIVPSAYTHSVIDRLEAFGSKVGLDKSFWNGSFRESCGGDYYAGEDVTPIRVRRMFPTSLKDAEALASLVSLRNQLYKVGLWQTVRRLDRMVEDLQVPFPAVLETSPVLGKHSVLGYETQRMSKDTQAPQVKGVRLTTTIPINEIDGADALLKVLSESMTDWDKEVYTTAKFHFPKGMSEKDQRDILSAFSSAYAQKGTADSSSTDPEHLRRSGRPKSVRTEIGWNSPF